MDCGIKLIKYIIFIFNLIFMLTGMALIVAGVMVEMMYKEYFAFFSGKVNVSSFAIIAVGIVLFIVAFFGCCGAVKENYCMIVTYIILLCVVILAQIAIMVSAMYLRDEIESTLEGNMIRTIKETNNENEEMYTAWKHLQTTLGCCGVNAYTDWKQNPEMKNTVPDSCCILKKDKCGNFTDVNTIHKTGCVEKLKKVSESNVIMLGTVAGVFAFIQLIGVIISSCLAVSVRREYQSMK